MTRRAPEAQSLSLPGPCGPLEAVLETPREDPASLAVVCHPHPLHGGTMQNKVVQTLARSFTRLGACTLRFNFRGVGESAGEYADGEGEVDDALAAVAWLRERFPGRSLYLAGFSFGAIVALRAAKRIACAGLVTVAPPVHRLPESFAPPICSWLVIQGEADEIVAADGVRRWVEGLGDAPALELMPETGHFFHGRLPELARRVERQFADARAGAEVRGAVPC